MMDDSGQSGDEPKDFKPSRYMRARRPHLFSDSVTNTERTVTREAFSYHLETLTNQKSETDFEFFAQSLAEKFISPNLRPQTGPVGGGDGKTDAETYPVSEAVASRWFVPDLAGAHERWAFAFSAKKDWRGKVRADVASIAGTGRGYPRIYFITNQFVPAKDSAAVQDALLKEHGIPVLILDRTWLIERVFDHDSLKIAIDTLGVGAGTEHEVRKQGPEDFRRTNELDALHKTIGDGTNYDGTTAALAEDCLKAAILARGIERPREEVEGLFQRAIRIARDNKLDSCLLNATYTLAWTSFFWFDDPAAVNALYDQVESLALSSDVADDLERLSNLLPLLGNAVRFEKLSDEDAKLADRSAKLLEALDRLRKDTARANNALHAHALSLLVHLNNEVQPGGEGLDDLWDEFRDVIKQADGLGTFPFQTIANVLTEVGTVVVESDSFDQLYEVMTDALAARRSEGEAAKKNSERGFQKLDKGLAYDAIRWFGRAVTLLTKEEYEDELIQALIGSSIAYEEVGLLWASRNYALAAASHEFSAFKRTGSIGQVNPGVLNRQLWTEIKLGRVPNILAASELATIVGNACAKTKDQRERAEKKRHEDAEIIGSVLLRTDFKDLPRIVKLPDALERLGLDLCRMATLFLLGHEDTLRREGWVPPDETPEGYQQLFEHWSAIGVRSELPTPDYQFGDIVTLRSRILGCQVEVACSNNLTSVGIGEAILGTLEALLATSMSHRMLPHLDVLRLEVKPVKGAALRPALEFENKNGFDVGVVSHAPELVCTTREEAATFPNWLYGAVVQIFVRFAVPADMEAWSESVLGEENGFSRALTFSHVPNMLGIIFGGKPRLSVDDWVEEQDTAFDVKRSSPWVSSLKPVEQTEDDDQPIQFGEGEPPEEILNRERLRHTDMQVVSPIDVHKWNAASWNACLFQCVPGSPFEPPILALAFENGEAAEGIFQGFEARFGQHDANNDLRIAIIRGVHISNPHAYAVIVGPNLDNFPKTKGSTFGFISRINIMRPTTSRNLDMFLEEFKRHGRFALASALLERRDGVPMPLPGMLGKYHLVVRDAWQISANDPDGVVLDPEDPPFIPPDQTPAPVLKALAWMEKMRGKQTAAKFGRA